MNDEERRLWILNDEGLYQWWRTSGKSLWVFIEDRRADIDEVIRNIMTGRKQSHYLLYG